MTRGVSLGIKENNDQLGELGNILMKGRKEMAKQRLFKCRINKVRTQNMDWYEWRLCNPVEKTWAQWVLRREFIPDLVDNDSVITQPEMDNNF